LSYLLKPLSQSIPLGSKSNIQERTEAERTSDKYVTTHQRLMVVLSTTEPAPETRQCLFSDAVNFKVRRWRPRYGDPLT